MRILEAVESYLADRRAAGVSEASLRVYARSLEPLARHLDGLTTQEITEEHMRGYLEAIRAGLKASTVNERVKRAAGLFTWLREQGRMHHDPTEGIELPPIEPAQLAISREIAARARGTGPLELRDRAILEVMAETGANASTIADMTQEDVDFDAGTLRIGPEVLLMPKDVMRHVRAYIDARDEALGILYGADVSSALWVSMSQFSTSRPLAAKSIRTIVKRYRMGSYRYKTADRKSDAAWSPA